MARNRRQAPTPTSTDIATRAYELYCSRGCQGGHDVEDWLQAERELREKTTTQRRRVPRRRVNGAEVVPMPIEIAPAHA